MNWRRPLPDALKAAVSLAFWLVVSAGPAEALKFTLGPDAGFDCDVALTYGAAWRTEGQDSKLLADVNGDDGDRNFDKWSMVNNRLGAVVDLDLHYKKFGFFLRPRAYYDFAYSGSNDNDSPATNNNGPANGGPLTDNNEFVKETKDRHGRKAEILDAFAYGKGSLGSTELVGRLGRQVVSWGESLFLQGGISSAQSPLDATAANVPGVELKDIFLPVGQGYTQIGKWGGLSLAGYYQWEWDKTRLDESGAYFSSADMIDDAGNHILVPVAEIGQTLTIDRTSDEHPRDSGQWGVALRYLADWLKNTEFGAYYVNYHEKIPMLIGKAGGGSFSQPFGSFQNLPVAPGVTLGQVDPATAAQLDFVDTFSYHLEYAEDVKLYGASFSTVLGGANVAGEFSYRHGLPVKVKDANPANILGFTYQEANVIQAQLSGIYVFGGGSLWDNCTFTGEAGFNRVNGIGSDAFFTDKTGYPFKSNDKFAWGYVAKFAFDYYQVLTGLDLQVPVTYRGNVNGVSSVPGTFAEGQDSLGVSFDFTYQGVYKIGIGYTGFFGGHHKNPKADRDFVSMNLKYTF
ncbi:MAG: DUF1302 domain-containing protein [Deltaproteobacteria bacterium]|nr:DUF1302 domain-containing protein [Deltaproteobacteria bacterium]